MFISDLFEASERRLVVVYPGRFQPFHRGHAGVFKQLQAKFGADNTWIATTPQVKIGEKNPFNATQKVELMHAAGVTDDRILLVSEPYKITAIQDTLNFDPANTVLIFAVGEPDKARLEVDAVYSEFTPTGRKSTIPPGKAVGDEKPMKTFRSLQDSVTVAQGHAYVVVVPEIEATVVIHGQKHDVSHGTECRNLWSQLQGDEQGRKEFLTGLYGRATPELAHIFDQIGSTKTVVAEPTRVTKLPKTLEPVGGVEKAAKRANKLIKESNKSTDLKASALLRRARVMHPLAHNDEQALALYINDKEERDVNHLDSEEHYLEKKMQELEQKINNLDYHFKSHPKESIKEAGGVGVVKGGNDPRYVMATAGDQNAVDGNTLGREMKAFGLVGRKNPGINKQQTPVNKKIGQGINENNDNDEIRHKMAKLQASMIEMAHDEIDRIKSRMSNEHDPKMIQHYKQRLQQQRDKILKIMTPGM
jgi:Cytidylyltransferase-like